MRKLKFGWRYRGCRIVRDGDGFRFELQENCAVVRTPKETEKKIDARPLKKLRLAAV